MDGVAKSLKWIGEIDRIEVPFFQRPYVWSDVQFDALVRSFTESPNGQMPFFGSIILKQLEDYSNSKKRYSIIDGQQRLTTFSILIRALLDVFKSNNISIPATAENQLKLCVYKIFIDSDLNEVYTNKLIPSNADKKSFDKIMEANFSDSVDIDTLSDEPIHKAYKYFYNYFIDNPSVQKLFVSKLISDENCLIFIILDDNDDEQKIFDSVNSLGKSLSNSDIIKNYLFHRMKSLAEDDESKIQQIYNAYYTHWDDEFYNGDRKDFWYDEVVQGRIRSDNIECFLKDFATIKKIYAAKKTAGADGLCYAYKSHIDSLSLNQLFDFVKELSEYASVYFEYKTAYKKVSDFKWSDYQNRLLLILDKLDTTTFDPYILKILKEKPDDMEIKLFNLERFFLHRFIYEGTTKNYNQCCEALINSVDDKAYLNKYMDDSPVSDDYKHKFRRMTNKQGLLFVFLLELLARKNDESKYSDVLNINAFSLEHIMPQKWQEKWMGCSSYDENGNVVTSIEEFVSNRNMAVGSIGNFALLTSALNSSVSNDSFSIKIDGNGKKQGIRQYAANLIHTKEIIKIFDETKLWDERNIFERESRFFKQLNDFYHFV